MEVASAKPAFRIEAEKRLYCPQCGSQRLYKSGKRKLADGSTTQRFLCRNCAYRFSESSLNKPRIKKNTDAHGELVLLMEEPEADGKRAASTRESITLSNVSPADLKGKSLSSHGGLKKKATVKAQ